MRERDGRSGISRLRRPKNPEKKASKLRTIRACEGVTSRNKDYCQKKAEQQTQKLKSLDERYAVIVKVFMNELSKRNTSINSHEIYERIDEILSSISKGSYYQTRFAGDNISDIRNAILRKVNAIKFENDIERE